VAVPGVWNPVRGLQLESILHRMLHEKDGSRVISVVSFGCTEKHLRQIMERIGIGNQRGE